MSDVCATCMKLKLKLKDPDMTEEEKQREATMFVLNRRRSRRFFDLMNAVSDDITICFDVMKNLVFPKTSVHEVCYSRQLYIYVFAVSSDVAVKAELTR